MKRRKQNTDMSEPKDIKRKKTKSPAKVKANGTGKSNGKVYTGGTHPTTTPPTVAKRIRVYRNGDPYHKGITVVLNIRNVHDINALLDAISERIGLLNGAQRLYTLNGTQVKSTSALENNKEYVASSGGFVSVPYGQGNKPSTHLPRKENSAFSISSRNSKLSSPRRMNRSASDMKSSLTVRSASTVSSKPSKRAQSLTTKRKGETKLAVKKKKDEEIQEKKVKTVKKRSVEPKSNLKESGKSKSPAKIKKIKKKKEKQDEAKEVKPAEHHVHLQEPPKSPPPKSPSPKSPSPARPESRHSTRPNTVESVKRSESGASKRRDSNKSTKSNKRPDTSGSVKSSKRPDTLTSRHEHHVAIDHERHHESRRSSVKSPRSARSATPRSDRSLTPKSDRSVTPRSSRSHRSEHEGHHTDHEDHHSDHSHYGDHDGDHTDRSHHTDHDTHGITDETDEDLYPSRTHSRQSHRSHHTDNEHSDRDHTDHSRAHSRASATSTHSGKSHESQGKTAAHDVPLEAL